MFVPQAQLPTSVSKEPAAGSPSVWLKERVRRSLKVLLPVAVALFAMVAWQVYATRQANFLIPSTVQILATIPSLLVSPNVWSGLLESGFAMIAGYVLAIAAGIPLGFAMGRLRPLDVVLQPYLDIAMVVPMAAMMPLVMMAIGITTEAQIAVVWLFAVPYIVSATRAGARGVDPLLVEMARAFGASELRVWGEILIPGTAPAVFTGLVLGLGQAITGIVVVELTLVALGVGQLILDYQAHFESAELFGLVAVIGMLAVATMSLLRRLERRVNQEASSTSMKVAP